MRHDLLSVLPLAGSSACARHVTSRKRSRHRAGGDDKAGDAGADKNARTGNTSDVHSSDDGDDGKHKKAASRAVGAWRRGRGSAARGRSCRSDRGSERVTSGTAATPGTRQRSLDAFFMARGPAPASSAPAVLPAPLDASAVVAIDVDKPVLTHRQPAPSAQADSSRTGNGSSGGASTATTLDRPGDTNAEGSSPTPSESDLSSQIREGRGNGHRGRSRRRGRAGKQTVRGRITSAKRATAPSAPTPTSPVAISGSPASPRKPAGLLAFFKPVPRSPSSGGGGGGAASLSVSAEATACPPATPLPAVGASASPADVPPLPQPLSPSPPDALPIDLTASPRGPTPTSPQLPSPTPPSPPTSPPLRRSARLQERAAAATAAAAELRSESYSSGNGSVEGGADDSERHPHRLGRRLVAPTPADEASNTLSDDEDASSAQPTSRRRRLVHATPTEADTSASDEDIALPSSLSQTSPPCAAVAASPISCAPTGHEARPNPDHHAGATAGPISPARAPPPPPLPLDAIPCAVSLAVPWLGGLARAGTGVLARAQPLLPDQRASQPTLAASEGATAGPVPRADAASELAKEAAGAATVGAVPEPVATAVVSASTLTERAGASRAAAIARTNRMTMLLVEEVSGKDPKWEYLGGSTAKRSSTSQTARIQQQPLPATRHARMDSWRLSHSQVLGQ